ncbi:MAG TPA: endolytic transglycosylase MltG, partial [Anaerolineales bacterium]
MKRRSPLLAGLSLLLFFSLCVLILVILNITLVIPRRAAQTFGLPTDKLSYTQQLYYATLLTLQEESLTRPPIPLGEARLFRVDFGEPTASVIQRLQAEGMITSVEAFRNFLLYSGLDTTLQAGDYNLSPAMNAIEIAHALQDATPTHVTFRIFAGWRLEEIAAALPTSGLDISPEEFLTSARIPRSGYVFSPLL